MPASSPRPWHWGRALGSLFASQILVPPPPTAAPISSLISGAAPVGEIAPPTLPKTGFRGPRPPNPVLGRVGGAISALPPGPRNQAENRRRRGRGRDRNSGREKAAECTSPPWHSKAGPPPQTSHVCALTLPLPLALPLPGVGVSGAPRRAARKEACPCRSSFAAHGGHAMQVLVACKRRSLLAHQKQGMPLWLPRPMAKQRL
jgi:hypothetical protein